LEIELFENRKYLTHIRLWTDFFGSDASYGTKEGILISGIWFKNKFPTRPFYSKFSWLFELPKTLQKAKKIKEL